MEKFKSSKFTRYQDNFKTFFNSNFFKFNLSKRWENFKKDVQTI